MRQEHCAHISQTHLLKGPLIKDLLRCGGFPGREVGVILVVALAERSSAGWLRTGVTVFLEGRNSRILMPLRTKNCSCLLGGVFSEPGDF